MQQKIVKPETPRPNPDPVPINSKTQSVQKGPVADTKIL